MPENSFFSIFINTFRMPRPASSRSPTPVFDDLVRTVQSRYCLDIGHGVSSGIVDSLGGIHKLSNGATERVLREELDGLEAS